MEDIRDFQINCVECGVGVLATVGIYVWLTWHPSAIWMWLFDVQWVFIVLFVAVLGYLCLRYRSLRGEWRMLRDIRCMRKAYARYDMDVIMIRTYIDEDTQAKVIEVQARPRLPKKGEQI